MNAKQMIAVAALSAAAVTSQNTLAQYETDEIRAEFIGQLTKAYENKDYEKVNEIKAMIIKHSEEKKALNEKQMKEMKALMEDGQGKP